MPKHYLVTGGAGFIGSSIANALLERGDKVRIIDDFSTGKRDNIPEGAELIQGSITDIKIITKACKGIDGVFHTAALPRIQASIENPERTHEVNVTGTLNVFLAAKEARVKRVVYSASSSAYGDQLELPLHEKMNPNPKSPYGLHKLVGEYYAKLATLFWNLETVSLRYFNVYGPRMAFEGAYITVIAIFLTQAAADKPLTIVGDGVQTRDFTFIDDVVLANLLAMEKDTVGKGEIINIGAGHNHSVNEVAQIIGGPTVNIPPRIEIHDTLADTHVAKSLLGWQPKMKFKEGMKRTIEWFTAMPSTDQTKGRALRGSRFESSRQLGRVGEKK